MAIYHHSATVVKRSSGKSAVAAAAYRAGEEILDLRTGITHDYTKKSGVDHSEIITPALPTIAQIWLTDRAQLWNQVEANEKRHDSQLAREINIAIPTELDREAQIALVREYVKTNYVNRGMVADVNFHHLQSNNPHAHIMLTMRDLIVTDGQVQFGNKNRDWNSKDLLVEQRQSWETLTNQYLVEAGYDHIRIDCRSLEEQGIERIPQIHLGANVNAMRSKGIPTDRSDHYDQIEKANEQIRANLERVYRASTTAKTTNKTTQQPEETTLDRITAQVAKFLEQPAEISPTPLRAVARQKIISDDQAQRVVEWARQNLPIKDGELENKISSTVRPVEISARCEQPNSASINFILTDLTTNELVEINCQRSNGTIQNITGVMTAQIANQIAAIDSIVLKERLTAARNTAPTATPTVKLEPPSPKANPAPPEQSSPLVTPTPTPTPTPTAVSKPDPAEFNQRLRQKASQKEREARQQHLKQIKDLNALPKRSIINWRGLSDSEFTARKAAIDQEHQRRLAEIERILVANLKPIPKLTQQEITAQAKAKAQQTMQEYRERQASDESQKSEAEQSKAEQLRKIKQQYTPKPSTKPRKDLGGR